MKHTAKQV